MALDGYNRYTGTGRPIDDMGETTPEVEVSESVRPWGKFLPAPYLPVGRFDVHKRANVVLSVGTPVALDARGSLIPAGIPGQHVFEFDSDDYRTGLAATRNPATGAAVTSAVTEAQMANGLLAPSGFARAVGVTSYNVFSHEGGVSFDSWPTYTLTKDNPVNFSVHNTMAQDLVAITCDYCLLVPYLPGRNLLGTGTKAFDNGAAQVDVLTKKAKSYVFAHDELIATGATLTSGMSVVFVSPNIGSDVSGTVAAANPPGGVLGTNAGAQFVAPGDAAGTARDISKAGLTILHSSDTAKYIVVKNPADQLAHGAGPDAGDGAGVLASGNLTFSLGSSIVPGDFVVPRVGKFVKFDASRHDADEICGQVLAVDSDVTDKSYLSRVKSAYERASSAGDLMPGSATRGVPFNLHMVTDGAWRQYTKQEKLDGTTLTTGALTAPVLRLITINLLK